MRIDVVTEGLGRIPDYAHPGDAGADLYAANELPVVIGPGERKAIPTGLRCSIPEGYEMQIRSRSGLSLKHGVVVANAPGTIDAGYRGEIAVILHNTDRSSPFAVSAGMRVAQAVIAPVVRAEFCLSSELDKTMRGEGGFGSSGE